MFTKKQFIDDPRLWVVVDEEDKIPPPFLPVNKSTAEPLVVLMNSLLDSGLSKESVVARILSASREELNKLLSLCTVKATVVDTYSVLYDERFALAA